MAAQRALVTGASSGIGKAFAEELACRGWALTVVARDGERLEALRKRLEQEHGADVRVLVADLTRRQDLARVETELAGDESLAMLVNNAGVTWVMSLAQLDPDKMEEIIQLKTIAVPRLTRAVLPGMLQRGHGTIIQMSSMAAFFWPPESATYCGANAFINAFTASLAQEIAGTGVRVQVLCPGMTRSEMYVRGGFDVSWCESWMTPEQVVDASLVSLELGELFCVPGLQDAELATRVLDTGAAMLEQTLTSVVAERYLVK